ncbi:hypothetical protein [Agitococcus lubricus]|uniref:Uncharacterized protein n=1 Tax=Agitococcus lubricus TaxID=1077255 RepID=A0A2T5IT95_9GAMM|nr:hypothetical protein [Agitococcus lubricus]PTQ87080.1 hypothetical protein C8N29_1242 [Agitococcus lubricus]
MSVVRFLPIILLTCINQSFGYSNSNEFDSEPQPKTDNANLKKDACNLASTFGLKSLCASKIPDENEKRLNEQYKNEIINRITKSVNTCVALYCTAEHDCFYPIRRYKFDKNILPEEDCMKMATELRNEITTEREKKRQAQEEKEREEENIKKQAEQVNQDFINSPTFNKLLMVGQILNANKKIENAQKEQNRQKEIGNQSGYINTSAIYNAGVTIVDNKELKKQLFQDYKKLGGIARNEPELIKLYANCNQLNGLSVIDTYILGANGWLVKWDETKRNDVIATASCF